MDNQEASNTDSLMDKLLDDELLNLENETNENNISSSSLSSDSSSISSDDDDEESSEDEKKIKQINKKSVLEKKITSNSTTSISTSVRTSPPKQCNGLKTDKTRSQIQKEYIQVDKTGAMARARALAGPTPIIRNNNNRKKVTIFDAYGGLSSSKGLTALGTVKRDRRSIEEIQRDIKRSRTASVSEQLIGTDQEILKGKKYKEHKNNPRSRTYTAPNVSNTPLTNTTSHQTVIPSNESRQNHRTSRLLTNSKVDTVRSRLAKKIQGKSRGSIINKNNNNGNNPNDNNKKRKKNEIMINKINSNDHSLSVNQSKDIDDNIEMKKQKTLKNIVNDTNNEDNLNKSKELIDTYNWDAKDLLSDIRDTLKKFKKMQTWSKQKKKEVIIEKFVKYLIEIGSTIDKIIKKEINNLNKKKEENECIHILAEKLWLHASSFTNKSPVELESLYHDIFKDALRSQK